MRGSRPQLPPKRSVTTTSACIAEAITLVSQPPVRDALAFLGSVVGAKALIRVFEKLEESGVMDRVRSLQCIRCFVHARRRRHRMPPTGLPLTLPFSQQKHRS